MVLGIVLVTVPKWKEVALEMAGAKAAIKILSERTQTLESEKATLGQQVQAITATYKNSQASLINL